MTEPDQPSQTAAAGKHAEQATPTEPLADMRQLTDLANNESRSETRRGKLNEKENSRAAQPKTSDSDEPTEPAETGELKKDQPTVVSREDKRIEDLTGRVAKAEEKMEQLLAVNREMSLFFSEQMEAVEALKTVERFLRSDPTLKKKFEKYLDSATQRQADPAQVQKTVRMRGTLSRLERFGTL